ncbi:MAG: formylglycine-generating enzyme family protein [Planctomycetota bacterium]
MSRETRCHGTTLSGVSRADLVSAFELPDSEFERAAAILGYGADGEIDSHEGSVGKQSKGDGVEDEATEGGDAPDPPIPTATPNVATTLRTWRLVAYERLGNDDKPKRIVSQRPTRSETSGTRPRSQPLAPVGSLLVRLRRTWEERTTRGVDVAAVIHRISHGEMLAEIPRKQERKWGQRLRIVIDRHERLLPYWFDQEELLRALRKLFPRNGVEVDVVSEIDEGLLGSQVLTEDELERQWLVLGDLGALETRWEGTIGSWRNLGEQIRRSGGRPLALLPCAASRIPIELRTVWDIMEWERPFGASRNETGASDAPEPLSLLQILLAHAIRLEPGLVRAMRRILPSGASDAGLESLFWQDPAMLGTSLECGCWHPDEARRLRNEFRNLTVPDADALRRQSAIVLKSWREHLPDEIFFEEVLSIGEDKALIEDLGWQLLYEKAMDYVRWLQQNPEELARTSTRFAWLGRFMARISDSTRSGSPVSEELATLWSMVQGTDPNADQVATVCESDSGLDVRWEEIGKASRRVVANISTRNGFVTLGRPFWKGDPPDFARRWGHDEFGPWFEFEVERPGESAVSQRMRWIPAGSFQMGSPDNEKGRDSDEGPRHEVILSSGFWIFDTPCTQRLWCAVMEKNPSHFKGELRPVESVSWEDANRFVDRLRDRIGLSLRLPTEAQWEYSCRAGSTTAYHFGDKITSRDARFESSDGTVDVGQYAANDRGLLDMHGNVDEWCLDGRRDYRGESVVDPLGPTKVGAGRVVRGGGWNILARLARAACRGAYRPGIRFSNLGFRCVGVQSGAEPLEPESSERAERGAEPARGGGAVSIRIERQPRELELSSTGVTVLRTDREELRLEPFENPAWAEGFGRDRYGLWADLRVDAIRRTSGSRRKTVPVIQRLRWISPGELRMGSPEGEAGRFGDEGPVHSVTLTTGFWMFDAPCTQGLWNAVMDGNPSHFQDPLRPVESVDFAQACDFAVRLTQNIDGLEFDLPSEAQWEYACRAGTTSAIYTGDLKIVGDANAPVLDPVAWYAGNSGVDYDHEKSVQITHVSDSQYDFEGGGTRQVKQKRSNPWGLYDMLGNVWEWCRDGKRSYHDAPASDPLGPTEDDASRVIRGGSWYDHAQYVRAASRSANRPGNRNGDLGFRCVGVQAPREASASRGAEGRGGPKTQRAQRGEA